jgi:hypothetical protein
LKKQVQTQSSSISNLLLELSREASRFGMQPYPKKLQILQTLKDLSHFKAAQIKEYRRLLLFIAAYPASSNEYRQALLDLKTLGEKVQSLNKENKKTLEQSGLPNTVLHGIYSFQLVLWLIKNTKIKLQLDFFEEGALHPREALRDSFNEMEFELEGREQLSALKWLELAFGSKDPEYTLLALVNHIQNQAIAASRKDHLFEVMRVCVKFECGTLVPTLSFPKPIFYHTEALLKRFDEEALITEPLPKPRTLSLKQKHEIISCARLSLLYLNRETDPVSLCKASDIEYYELNRGFSIALFSAEAERRLPLESYIGFMLFKNGFPVSYGGAWLFGKRSLLGINIYESYRGGESAYLFSQLLRTYKQRFSPSYIEVEPYQFGKGNPEGIKTGAFWFYYRFGFRPLDKVLRQLASKEFDKIQKNKGYKSSITVLKAFTQSNLMLSLEEKPINLDPYIISAFVTETIRIKFKGNRLLFKTWALNELSKHLGIHFSKLSKSEKTGIEKLYSFLSICLDFTRMSKQQKESLRSLILQKGKSEFQYAEACEKFPFEEFIAPTELKKQLGI